MTRNDAARREFNAALRPGDVWAEKERWRACVLDAKRRLTACGVERPEGLPAGTLVLDYYMLASTGYVKWTLRCEIGRQWVAIGGFVTEYLPDDDRPRMAMKPLETHGKLVVVNQKVSGELARPVRVLIDAEGMPVPVPEQMWRQYGLE